MVHIQQRALGAFKQQALARFHGIVKVRAGIGDQRKNTNTIQQGARHNRVRVNFLGTQQPQLGVVQGNQLTQALFKHGGIAQMMSPYRPACDLVFVSGSNTASGGANLDGAAFAACFFTGQVQRHVGIENQRCCLRYQNAAVRIGNPQLGQVIQLLEQFAHRQHHAIAHNGRHAFPHDPTGHHMQREPLAIDNQRMPRVVAALKSNHHVVLIRQVIHDFAFAFIAPLGAHNHRIVRHVLTHFLNEIFGRSSGGGKGLPCTSQSHSITALSSLEYNGVKGMPKSVNHQAIAASLSEASCSVSNRPLESYAWVRYKKKFSFS